MTAVTLYGTGSSNVLVAFFRMLKEGESVEIERYERERLQVKFGRIVFWFSQYV